MGSSVFGATFPEPQTLTLDWRRYREGRWCPLLTVNLADPHFTAREGVYAVFRPSDGQAIRVGQGAIAERLGEHRRDPRILAHGLTGLLVATWADVAPVWRDGVERYLAERLRPLVSSALPNVLPITVNLPASSFVGM